jgi:hypothetical protein
LKGNTVAFVNEYISAEDRQAYGIEAIDQNFVTGGTNSRQWTIDRARDIYLRMVTRGREEVAHQSTWTLYWHGELIVVDLSLVATSISSDRQSGSARYQLRRLRLPPYLDEQRDEVMSDLRKALLAYKDGGVYAVASSFALVIE